MADDEWCFLSLLLSCFVLVFVSVIRDIRASGAFSAVVPAPLFRFRFLPPFPAFVFAWLFPSYLHLFSYESRVIANLMSNSFFFKTRFS